jgi:hypothetical protein
MPARIMSRKIKENSCDCTAFRSGRDRDRMRPRREREWDQTSRVPTPFVESSSDLADLRYVGAARDFVFMTLVEQKRIFESVSARSFFSEST